MLQLFCSARNQPRQNTASRQHRSAYSLLLIWARYSRVHIQTCQYSAYSYARIFILMSTRRWPCVRTHIREHELALMQCIPISTSTRENTRTSLRSHVIPHSCCCYHRAHIFCPTSSYQTPVFILGWLSTIAREFGYKWIRVTTPTCAREFLSRNDKRKQQTGWWVTKKK